MMICGIGWRLFCRTAKTTKRRFQRGPGSVIWANLFLRPAALADRVARQPLINTANPEMGVLARIGYVSIPHPSGCRSAVFRRYR